MKYADKIEEIRRKSRILEEIDVDSLKDLHILSKSKDDDAIILLDTDKITYIYHFCSGKVLLDTIVKYNLNQSHGGSMVFKTSKQWILMHQSMLDEKGWAPISFPGSDYDEIIPMINGTYILYKGQKSWFAKIITYQDQHVLVTLNSPIIGHTFYYGYNGFFAQCKESSNTYFRFFEFPSDARLEEVASSSKDISDTLSWSKSVKADSIELISDYNNTLIYQLQGIKYYYAFEKDSILDRGFSSYYVDALFNRVVIKKNNYLGCFTRPYYGGRYIKLQFPNFKELYIDDRGNDAFLGYITTTDNKEYFYSFDSAEAMDSMTVSPALKRLIPNGFPYLEKTFDKLKTGELCFVSDKNSRLLVQSADGKIIQEVTLEYAAQKNEVTVIASSDFWYINPISYFMPDTSFVETHFRSKYDKIIPLEKMAYLGIRGTEKWLVNYDEVKSRYTSPIPLHFVGEKFVDNGGGLIVNISPTSKPDYRFVKYHSRLLKLICNPKTGNWESAPLSYLPVPGFEADNILLYADQTDGSTIVYSKNGKVFAFDIDNERIYEIKDGKYFVSPHDGRVIFQSDESLIASFHDAEIYYTPGIKDYKVKSLGQLSLATINYEGGEKSTIILNKGFKCP